MNMEKSKKINQPAISFILPTLNEERNIGRALHSIARWLQDQFPFEMIVVDHGSKDRTKEIAAESGAKVYGQSGGTIGSLRNLGARHASGDILVFLDADVELTAEWARRFPAALHLLYENTMLITGSHCNAPVNGTWIERYWFRNFASEHNVSHIGTGHLIVSRSTFDTVGCFSESLQTGEDYEFCRRVIQAGGKIINDPALEVIHHEYPKNLADFMRREAWHGRGDIQSWKNYCGSKVAIAATFFFTLQLGILMGVMIGGTFLFLSAVATFLLFGLLFISAAFKYWHCSWKVIIINSMIFYFYYLGRCLVLFVPRRNGYVPETRRGVVHKPQSK